MVREVGVTLGIWVVVDVRCSHCGDESSDFEGSGEGKSSSGIGGG